MDDPRQAPDVEAIVESIDGASEGDLSAGGPALASPTADETDGARPPETISRLADDLLPALIARLDASGLGELEVRTNAWRIRLRKPYDRRRTVPLPEGRRRRGGVFEPGSPGHAGTHGVGRDEPRPGEPAGAPAAQGSGSAGMPTARGVRGDRRTEGRIGGGRAGEARGAGAGVGVDVRRDLDTGDDLPAGIDPSAPAIATSPAVGYFTPREGWTTGRHVLSGDVVGYVDCLGVRQDVVAPADGFVGRLLAQAGEAVEYGQPLVHVDLPLLVSPAPGPPEVTSAPEVASATMPPSASDAPATGPEGT